MEKLMRVLEQVEWAASQVSEHGSGMFGYIVPCKETDHALVLAALVREPACAYSHARWMEALENAFALADHPDLPSSWLIRDAKTCVTGGAVASREGILSFIGMNERENEAAMLLAAVKLGWLTPMEATCIANCSDNKAYLKAASKCGIKPI